MTSTVSSVPSPISVSTSQVWDSDGAGLWSTFAITIGTPASSTRVLISTASSETWAVAPFGCTAIYGVPENLQSTCSSDRGLIFDPANSTTWSNISNDYLGLDQYLGYKGVGEYGHDVVTLDFVGSGGPSLSDQVVAAIGYPDFWLGHLGIDPEPVNFTTFNDPQPSFLGTLFNKSMIPSLSWGYTAGAQYRNAKVQGSLTLGGYDQSRFEPENLTYPMYESTGMRFLVNLVNITVGSTNAQDINMEPQALMTTEASLFIDSTVPYLYLPIEVCDEFETSFGLQWNEASEIYTLNSTMRSTLQQSNVNITFTLKNPQGNELDIVFPYAAFDLNATFPVVNESTSYFPLQRAANESQYTIGRVFLQEVYLIADYQRLSFSVSQCTWPSEFDENLVAISPPLGNDTSNTAAGSGYKLNADSGQSRSWWSNHSYVAGVAGGLIVLALVFGFYYFFRQRRKKRDLLSSDAETLKSSHTSSVQESKVIPKSELDALANERSEIDGTTFCGPQLDGIERLEVDGSKCMSSELSGTDGVKLELASWEVFEMPAREEVPQEVDAHSICKQSDIPLSAEVQSSSQSVESPPDSAISCRSGHSYLSGKSDHLDR